MSQIARGREFLPDVERKVEGVNGTCRIRFSTRCTLGSFVKGSVQGLSLKENEKLGSL